VRAVLQVRAVGAGRRRLVGAEEELRQEGPLVAVVVYIAPCGNAVLLCANVDVVVMAAAMLFVLRNPLWS